MFTSYWLLQFFLTGMELLLYDWGKELFQNWLFTISVTSVCHVSFTHWTGTAERYDDNLPWGEIIVLEISFICQSVSHRSSCCCFFFYFVFNCCYRTELLLFVHFIALTILSPFQCRPHFLWMMHYICESFACYVSYQSRDHRGLCELSITNFCPPGGKKALIWDL